MSRMQIELNVTRAERSIETTRRDEDHGQPIKILFRAEEIEELGALSLSLC
jgi:hypothetical protein